MTLWTHSRQPLRLPVTVVVVAVVVTSSVVPVAQLQVSSVHDIPKRDCLRLATTRED